MVTSLGPPRASRQHSPPTPPNGPLSGGSPQVALLQEDGTDEEVEEIDFEKDEDEDEDENENEDEDEDDAEGPDLHSNVLLPTVNNPSQDIIGDLANAFEQNIEFQGTYYFSKTHPSAPVPGLCIEGLGRIGLPLSDRDAREIIRRSNHSPFGKGERTIVDPNVRDTWEIDATKVYLESPRWSAFMTNVVAEVCEALGVHLEESRPHCEMYKLLLYETGSHFLAHQDTEKTPGMFATIIILLPSEFSGGSLHLSHGGSSTTIDHSAESAFTTSVIAWYTDVLHEVKPVTSGYRLALSYNLIHTTDTLRPSLSTSLNCLERLRHVLLSWQQTLASAPRKIMYLLDHKYARASLRGSSLKGSDAHLVGVLKPLADECQIQLGLASIESYINGVAEEDYGPYGRGRRRGFLCAYADSDSDSDKDVDEALPMGDIIETYMTIGPLVDLNGRELLKSLDEEVDDSETIPECLREEVESGSPDKQEYEGYQGNYGGTVEQWYRRTVLVIWPLRREDDLLRGNPLESRMLQVLNAVEGGHDPTPEERAALAFLLTVPPQYKAHASVARAICRAAAEWRDPDVWARAFNEFGGKTSLKKLGKAVYVSSIEKLGLDFVLPHLFKALDTDSDDSDRLTFLQVIARSLRDLGRPELTEWIPAAKSRVLKSLRLLDLSVPATAPANFPKVAALIKHHRLSSIDPPFASYYKSAIVAWCQASLGNPPASVGHALDGVRGISCPCEYCRQLVAFFKNSKPSCSFDRIGAPSAKHLDHVLASTKNANKVARWQITRHRSPQGFEVHKRQDVIQAALYRDKQKEGIRLLRQVSTDETVLHRILGDDYLVLCRRLGTRWINHELPPVQPQGPVDSQLVQLSKKTSRPQWAAPESSNKRQKTERQFAEVINLTSP